MWHIEYILITSLNCNQRTIIYGVPPQIKRTPCPLPQLQPKVHTKRLFVLI